ncbi:hypothetical protein [Robbsia andropogonis]|nr:hypothetical protein [Robbsia andropogonis]MCP1118584.1 hypothetical protein [Robbsia andropogonis]MCP1128051.1 hypothetical protein [Robbsia andropogonis]
MSSASDISNLFKMAGASPAQYHEVEGAEQLHGKRGRWSVARAEPIDESWVAVARPTPSVPLHTLEPVHAEPEQQRMLTRPIAASESPPAMSSAPRKAAVQAKREPVFAQKQSAPLSSVFARLAERSVARTDTSPHRLS